MYVCTYGFGKARMITDLCVAKYWSALVFLLPILIFKVIALDLEFILRQYYNSFLGPVFK